MEKTDNTQLVAESMRRAAVFDQAKLCRESGSEFTVCVSGCFAHRTDRPTLFCRIIQDWTGLLDAMNDALLLRVCAGLHIPSRTGRSGPLTTVYPPNETRLSQVMTVAIAQEDECLTDWLAKALQTNEVARSVCLYQGLSFTTRSKCNHKTYGTVWRRSQSGTGVGMGSIRIGKGRAAGAKTALLANAHTHCKWIDRKLSHPES